MDAVLVLGSTATRASMVTAPAVSPKDSLALAIARNASTFHPSATAKRSVSRPADVCPASSNAVPSVVRALLR